MYEFLPDRTDYTDILAPASLCMRSDSQADIPTKITGEYQDDYNIAFVDNIIQRLLTYEQTKGYLTIQKDIEHYQQLVGYQQTRIERSRCLQEIDKLTRQLADIRSGEKRRRYTNSVKDLLTEYNKLKPVVKIVSFDGEEATTEDSRTRLIIIDRYLSIASEYINLDISHVITAVEDECQGCGISLAKIQPLINGVKQCPNCRVELHNIVIHKTSKDSSRVVASSTGEDDSIDNFMRAFDRYQGRQLDQPPEQLYVDLDVYFTSRGRPTGEEVKKLPLNSRGRRGDTTHKMMWDALSAIGYYEYYEDTNLIASKYWGWTLPDVERHRSSIQIHYLKTQAVYYNIPDRGRDSSLGTQFRLWRHLQLVGHECYPDEFKIAENPDSLNNHNRLWAIMCEGAADPDIYYID